MNINARQHVLLTTTFLVLNACDSTSTKTPRAWTPPDLCANATVRVMPIGDSLVAGVSVNGSDFGGTNGSFRTLLYTTMSTSSRPLEFVGDQNNGPSVYPLQARRHQALPGWKVRMLSEGGGPATVPPVQGQLPNWLQRHTPQIIIAVPGMEDLWLQNDEKKSFAQSLATNDVVSFIDYLMELAPQAYILVANHPPVGRAGDGNDNWYQLVRWYNDELLSIEQNNYDGSNGQVKFVDIFSQLDRTVDLSADGGHPNPHGYARIAAALEDVLRPLTTCDP